MRLPELAIRRTPFTLVVILLLTCLGVLSFLTMPRSEDPQFATSTVRVIAVYPGANPEDVEQLVVDPIEESVNEIDDVDRIESSIQDGLAITSIDFLASVDPDDALEDVTQQVSEVRASLPDGVRQVDVDDFTTTNVTVYQVALTSDTAAYRTLETAAEQVEQRLERVSGIKTADTWAYPEQRVTVGLDLLRIRELGLSFDRVVGAIQSAAPNVPGGEVEAGTRRFTVQTSGDYASINEIRRTVVGATASSIIRLEDVATVEPGYEDETHRARFNGRRAVFVTVTQRKGVNIFNVLDAVKAELDAARAELPAGVQLHEVFDQSESVSNRVNGFFSNLLQGILLVGIVVLLALGRRASVIVMLAIPLSILIAIWLLDLTGYGLQQISIVGLVIALGLLVDDAIVITENVARFRRQGLGRIQAAVEGTREVGWAVISTSVTSVLAFLPIVLVQSGSGDFIRSMPFTVILALGASLLVSLTLTPLLAARWLERGDSSQPPAPDSDSDEGEKAQAARRPGRPGPARSEDGSGGILQRVLDRVVAGPYTALLTGALRRPAWVLCVAVAAFVGSVSLFPVIGVSFFPDAEKPQFLVNVTTEEGATLGATDEAVQRVEGWLAERPDVRRYAANVGRDNPIVYYNVIPRRERANVGQVFVEAATADDVPALADAIRADLGTRPGVTVEPVVFKNGPPVEAPIAIKVIGPDLQTLDRLAAEVTRLLERTPGTREVRNPLDEPKTDLHVDVSRDAAALHGVRLVDADRTVRAALAGLPVATYRDDAGDAVDVVVTLPRPTAADGQPQPRATVDDLQRIAVSTVTGGSVPLQQIADVELKPARPRIDHFDTERAITLTADVDTRAGFSAVGVTQQVTAELDTRTWPDGYRYFAGGELEAQEDSFASLLPALLGAILGILAVLVLQFDSFRQPFIIFTAIPLSVIGAFPALLLTGYTFSFTAFVGFTSLVGIVVNNSTLLVDYANQLRDAGHSIAEAITLSSTTRFTPILLTTLTTIGGLLPLTLSGSSLWSPLGWVIIGGLVVSTALTLLVVPVLYTLLTPERS
jgi:multidrug efflux pump subunit AcrB